MIAKANFELPLVIIDIIKKFSSCILHSVVILSSTIICISQKGHFSIVERDVSNVFYSERKVRVFYSQSDKILGVIYPK